MYARDTNVTSKWNVLWAQLDGPGTVPQLVSCYATDGAPKSWGAITPTHCWNPVTGKYDVTARKQAPPDPPTASIEGLTFKAASWMEKALRRGCPIYLYINSYECLPRDSFVGFNRGQVFKAAMPQTKTPAGMLTRDDETDMLHTIDFQMEDTEEYFTAAAYRRVTAETNIARDLEVVGGPQCQGNCGAGKDVGDVQYAVFDAGAGVAAHVQYSVDGGQTWTNTSADPLQADEDIASIVSIPWDRTHYRLIVALGTTRPAAPMAIVYTDVDIVNAPATTVWTSVDVGATNGEFALHSGALFAFNRFHIWLCTDQGEIYFSNDGGVTWTAQGAAAGDELNYVCFVSETIGVAVGGTAGVSHVLLYTIDGGLHWTAVPFTGPGATVMAYAVAVISAVWWYVTFEDGSIYVTFDGGANWTALPVAAPAGYTIPDMLDIAAVDECCLWACGRALEGANSYGIVLRSVNGGFDWENWLTDELDSAVGMYAVEPVSYNRGCSVGNIETTAMILDVTD